MNIRNQAAILVACTAVLGFGGSAVVPLCAAQTAQSQSAASRVMGTVKAVTEQGFTLTPDTGTEITVTPSDNARIRRTAPGQSLNDATPSQLSDIQVGDRVLVRGRAGDGKLFAASDIIVMKKTDIADKNTREMQDWQKRGIGGRVTAVDAAAGTVKVSSSGTGASQAITLHVSPTTVVRRYSPNSVKFDEATKATLDQVKVGDQLRARGNRSAEGAEMAADEIVAGTFHNIAGTVESTDASSRSFTVKDLATKKPVVIKITGDSQMRKLSPMMAQMIAMRFKPNAGGARPGQAAGEGRPGGPGGVGPNAGAMRQGFGPATGAGPNAGRGDLNQMLAHLPAVTVAELQKGDAVMVVATQGDGASVTAITMLSGVEPILTASPNDSMSFLSPWNLGGGGGEGGGESGGMGGGMGAGPQ